MTQTQLEEFRKWVEEKPGRSADIHISFNNKIPPEYNVWVWESGLCSQTVKTVDEINLEAIARERFEELKKKFEKGA